MDEEEQTVCFDERDVARVILAGGSPVMVSEFVVGSCGAFIGRHRAAALPFSVHPCECRGCNEPDLNIGVVIEYACRLLSEPG